MEPRIEFIIKIFMKIVKICPKSPRFTVLQTDKITIHAHKTVSVKQTQSCNYIQFKFQFQFNFIDSLKREILKLFLFTHGTIHMN